MKTTPLYEAHKRLGAQFAPFAGWQMPLRYQSAIQEYWAARGDDGAALFDVSHMARFFVVGPDALAVVQQATTNDAARLQDGQVQYSAILNEKAGFVDDLTVHRLSDARFLICANAGNRKAVWSVLQGVSEGRDARVEDATSRLALLALQGPAAERMLAEVAALRLSDLGYYRFIEAKIFGEDAIVARTGYTGEDGFEIYMPAASIERLWDALIQAGATPAGLACRDLLRTEMGYALYGHEIGPDITPLEAGLMWIVKLDKGDFLGREALLARMQQGVRQKLVGLVLEKGAPPPRAGYPVMGEGEEVGRITSGAYSPKLGRGVAMAFVAAEAAAREDFAVSIRGREYPARRVRPPFVVPRVKRAKEEA